MYLYSIKQEEWGKMNARDRATLIHRLADLMDEHKEELATIESIGNQQLRVKNQKEGKRERKIE